MAHNNNGDDFGHSVIPGMPPKSSYLNMSEFASILRVSSCLKRHTGDGDSDFEELYYPAQEEHVSALQPAHGMGGIHNERFNNASPPPIIATGRSLSYETVPRSGGYPFPELSASSELQRDTGDTVLHHPHPRRRAPTGGNSSLMGSPTNSVFLYNGSRSNAAAGGENLLHGNSRSPLSSPPIRASFYSLSPDMTSDCTASTFASPNTSTQMLIPKYIPPRRRSTALPNQEGVPIHDKPWIFKRDVKEYISWALTWSMMLFCAGAAAVMCLLDARSIKMMGNLCLVLEDDFSNGLNKDTWFHEVDMGGFG